MPMKLPGERKATMKDFGFVSIKDNKIKDNKQIRGMPRPLRSQSAQLAPTELQVRRGVGVAEALIRIFK